MLVVAVKQGTHCLLGRVRECNVVRGQHSPVTVFFVSLENFFEVFNEAELALPVGLQRHHHHGQNLLTERLALADFERAVDRAVVTLALLEVQQRLVAQRPEVAKVQARKVLPRLHVEAALFAAWFLFGLVVGDGDATSIKVSFCFSCQVPFVLHNHVDHSVQLFKSQVRPSTFECTKSEPVVRVPDRRIGLDDELEPPLSEGKPLLLFIGASKVVHCLHATRIKSNGLPVAINRTLNFIVLAVEVLVAFQKPERRGVEVVLLVHQVLRGCNVVRLHVDFVHTPVEVLVREVALDVVGVVVLDLLKNEVPAFLVLFSVALVFACLRLSWGKALLGHGVVFASSRVEVPGLVDHQGDAVSLLLLKA